MNIRRKSNNLAVHEILLIMQHERVDLMMKHFDMYHFNKKMLHALGARRVMQGLRL